MPPVSVKHELLKTFEKRHVHYTQTTGIPLLRKSIAKERSVREDNVIVSPQGLQYLAQWSLYYHLVMKW